MVVDLIFQILMVQVLKWFKMLMLIHNQNMQQPEMDQRHRVI